MSVIRPGKLVLYITDDKTQVAKMYVHLPTNSLLVDVAAYAVALSDAVDDIIEGKVISAHCSFPLSLSTTMKSNPTAISDVEETAGFIFGDTNKKPIVRVTLPTFKPSLVASDGVSLVSSGLINTFLNRIESGVGAIQACSSHGEDIVWTLSKYHRFKESRP